MSLLQTKRASSSLILQEKEKPELYRDLFSYSNISKTAFDGIFVTPRPAKEMFITDTTFRDGQQARPPYTANQIAEIYDLLYALGGRSGLIRACEFFMYSKKDREAIELCRSRNYNFPQITGWIRAHIEDLRLAKDMEFKEVGMLTSVSDYHTFLKLGWDRKKAFDNYIRIAEQALEWGISPRCHFEDITRSDVQGFCLPLAVKLMELSEQSGIPVKIRLCDTMGYGVPYPGAALPRSVPRIVRAFTDEAGVPGEWLEWHGHNDFHKALINGATAWLYGCAGVSSTLFGFGERTGNTPLEALVIEYISLTGKDDVADTRVIDQISQYFQKELDFEIPDNYPFVGKDFNATSAGVHVDGLAKNEEIYNIFDTKKILGRPVPIIITDKTGRAGVAYWINNNLNLPLEQQVSKGHPAVGLIYEKIVQAYEKGRNTSFSKKEMTALSKRYMPELFPSELERLRKIAKKLAANLIVRLAKNCSIQGAGNDKYPWMQEVIKSFPFIQYISLTDEKGHLLGYSIIDPRYKEQYAKLPLGFDFSSREWFIKAVQTGNLHVTDIHQSHFTEKLILSVSAPIFDEQDSIRGVVEVDIQLEELLKQADIIEENTKFD